MTTTLVSKRLSGNNQPQLREFLAGDSARKQSTPRPSPRSYSERMRERLDSRHWQRQGWFQPGLRFESQWSSDGKVVASVNVCTEVGRMILSYVNRRNDGSWQNMEYGVSISWTRCHYGGARAWLICPARQCGRRVAILYFRICLSNASSATSRSLFPVLSVASPGPSSTRRIPSADT
jgi:hypothetical protein